jgi:2-polyprenyl-3-methyl-5-hydroxy-6-metoxy-1,4-benzoquinol methylase
MKHTIAYSWKEVVQRLEEDYQWQKTTQYLSSSEYLNGINLKRLWQILDQAWDELLEKHQNRLDLSKFLHEYYQHPVWLINAAFSESDRETINDRLAAVRLITHVNPHKILDFGGGIGTVARLCTIKIPQAEIIDIVDITEFRHTVTQYLSYFPQIRVLEKPEPDYDAVICTEVLEHLIDPISTVVQINRLLRKGGGFAASWSFYPCIKCHLPQNFHLRSLMLWIIRSLGFGFYGFERRGSMVYAFMKHSEVTPAMIKQARLLELMSKVPIPLERLLLLIRGL